MEAKRRNQLVDEVLKMTKELRKITYPMTNEEKIFYLETLGIGIKSAGDMFRLFEANRKKS